MVVLAVLLFFLSMTVGPIRAVATPPAAKAPCTKGSRSNPVDQVYRVAEVAHSAFTPRSRTTSATVAASSSESCATEEPQAAFSVRGPPLQIDASPVENVASSPSRGWQAERDGFLPRPSNRVPPGRRMQKD